MYPNGKDCNVVHQPEKKNIYSSGLGEYKAMWWGEWDGESVYVIKSFIYLILTLYISNLECILKLKHLF